MVTAAEAEAEVRSNLKKTTLSVCCFKQTDNVIKDGEYIMHAKSIMFYFAITLIMFFWGICLFYWIDSNNQEEKKVEIALEEKYKTDFLYLDSIIDTDLNTQKYRFHSLDKSMIVTAYYDVSYNSGQINIFLPFYKHEFLYDDLREQIHQK